MKEVKIKVYEFRELNPEAQERAYNDWLYNEAYYPWFAENQQTLEEFGKMFGVKVIVKDLDYMGYSIYFEDKSIKKLSGESLINFLKEEFGSYLLDDEGYSKECPLTGYYLDNVILDPIYETIFRDYQYDNFADMIDACVRKFITAVKEDVDYYYSMDYFSEYCRENNLYFFENGTEFKGEF